MNQSQAITRFNEDIIQSANGRRSFTTSVQLAPNLTLAAGTLLGQITSSAASSVQTVASTGSPTGGTFTLSWNGQTTAGIPYNATAAQVQTAFTALSDVGVGNALASGGPIGTGGVAITFSGVLANLPLAAITVDYTGLTGGTSPTITITQTTTGVAQYKYAAYNHSNSDGTQTAIGILTVDCVTDAYGNITYGSQVTPEWGTEREVGMWYRGDFRIGDLIGLDSYCFSGAPYMRFINGSLTTPDGVLTY